MCSGFLDSIRWLRTDFAISPPGLFQILKTIFIPATRIRRSCDIKMQAVCCRQIFIKVLWV